MPWNCLNKRRFEGTHTTGDEGKFFFGFQLPVTGECQQMAQCSQSKLIPDGHFKFPQAGRLNYQFFGLAGFDLLSW